MLKSDLCDYKVAYILVKDDITIINSYLPIEVTFKKCTSFIKCITETDGTTIDDTEDLGLIMPMYNLLEYSSNYSDTTAILWFYFKDKATNFNANIEDDNAFKSFKYKD